MDDQRLDSWPAHLATAALTGDITAYLPVQRWSRPAQWGMHEGMGALSAGAVGWFMSRPEDPGSGPSTPPGAFTAVVALAGGLATAGLSRGGQAADTWVEDALAARGVRRPRVWMGVGAAGLSLAMSLADRRREDASRHEEPDPTGS